VHDLFAASDGEAGGGQGLERRVPRGLEQVEIEGGGGGDDGRRGRGGGGGAAAGATPNKRGYASRRAAQSAAW
jgi:hypothetical protein